MRGVQVNSDCFNEESEKRAHLNAAHQILYSVIKHMPSPVAIVDTASHNVIVGNEPFCQLCSNARVEASIEHLLGKQWVLQASKILIEQVRTRWATCCAIKLGGVDQHYLVDATGIDNGKGDVQGFCIVFKDPSVIEKVSKYRGILDSSLLQLLRSNTVGEMTTMLAHELNQPLTAILNYTDTCRHLLKSGSYSVDEIDGALIEIENMTHRTGHTLDRIRKMVSRKATVKKLTSPNSLVEDAMCVTEHKLRMSAILVDVNLAENLPVVFVDPIQIQQVIINLLINAIDAMEQDGASADSRLVVSTYWHNEGVITIQISDNGPGIDGSINGKLFSPFVSTKAEGLGVGLSICKNLIDAHGGEISLEANAIRGVTAKFTLPVGEAN